MHISFVSRLALILRFTVFLLLGLGGSTAYAQYFVNGCCDFPPPPCVIYKSPSHARYHAPRIHHPHRKHGNVSIAVYNVYNPFPSCSSCYNEDIWMPSTCTSCQGACHYYDVVYERPGSDFIMNVDESPVYDMGTEDNDIY